MSLHLHIDELVLDGLTLPPGGGDVLQRSLTAELSRLLGASRMPGTWNSSYAVPEATGAVVNVGRRTDPLVVGKQLGGVVHRSLTDSRPSPFIPHHSNSDR